jgi:SAM-dependent methyltransferase
LPVEFTAHNIRLDDGTFTKPDMGGSMETYPWFVSARRVLDTVIPGKKENVRLVDLGCLEGGYSVEFARMGFTVVGIEVRESNIAACNYVKARTNLPNLTFVKDDANNVARHGTFDVAFCCGLLYHLDKPRKFLATLGKVTKKLLILQTHFSGVKEDGTPLPEAAHLSALAENEGLPGHWFTEFEDGKEFDQREASRWASWDNRRSFWIHREYLLQTIRGVGFDLVMEQYDSLGPNLAESMVRGDYRNHGRGTFIGIKTG